MRRRLMLHDAQTTQNGLEAKSQTTLSSGTYEVRDNTFYIEPTVNAYKFAWDNFINPLQLSSGDVLTFSLLLIEGDKFTVRCAINTHRLGQEYGVLQANAAFTNNQANISFTMRSDDPPIEKMAIASDNNITQRKVIKVSAAVNGVTVF